MDDTALTKNDDSEEEEPLIPEIIDEEFLTDLTTKINDIIRHTRYKLDNAAGADNIQRIQLVSDEFKRKLEEEKLKCEDLNRQLDDFKAEIDDMNKLWQLDKDTINQLKGVIEGAWKQTDAAQAREQDSQEELNKLKEKVEHLEVIIQRVGERKGAANERKLREAANKERERLKQDINELNKKIKIQQMYLIEVEKTCKTLEEKNKTAITLLDECTVESFKDKKIVDELTKELADVKAEADKLEDRMKKVKNQNEQLLRQSVQHNLKILATKTHLDQLKTLHNISNNKLIKLQSELDSTTQERDSLKMECIQKTNTLKAKEEESSILKKENKAICKTHHNLMRKLTLIGKAKVKLTEDYLKLRTHASNLEKELFGETKAVEKLSRDVDQITGQRDYIKRELFTVQKLADDNNEKIDLGLLEIKKLNDAIRNHESKEIKYKTEINQKKTDISKNQDHINNLMKKMDDMDRELRLRALTIKDLTKEIAELQAKISAFTLQLEAELNEKSSIQRNLQQIINENEIANKNFQDAKNLADAFKEKLDNKNADAINLKIQIEKLEKERILLKNEIKNFQVVYQHTRSELVEKRVENDRLYYAVMDSNQNNSKIKKQFDKVIHKKDLVSGDLTKVNEDLSQLQDKLDRTQKALDLSEKSYGDALDNIRIMKIEIKNLQTERDVLKRDRECAANLRTELLQLHRNLNQERIKANALQDEMLNPLNIHRFRILAGKDPEKMELIKKIQTLQKRVLAQSVSAMVREKALEDSQKLYNAVKEFMLKLPSYKIKEELNEVKHNSKVKDKKIKALMAELTVKDLSEKSKDQAVEELRDNLTSAKKDLLQEKKKKRKLLEERQIIAQMQFQCFSAPPGVRIFGGGFKAPYGNLV